MNEEVVKLTDIINERVAELIQVGFNAVARTKFGSGPQVELPMTIVEKRNGIYHRIPEGPLPEWTEFCRYIREYIDKDGKMPGNQLCCDCDAVKAEEFFTGKKRTWEWYICHAGLVDIAIPIIVGGKVAAVFFGGQKRLKNNRMYDAELTRKITDLTDEIPGLNRNKLTKLVSNVPALLESKIQEFAGRLSEIVSHIGDLARRNFEARKTVTLMGRFSEEYMMRRRPLAEILVEIFAEVANFLSVEHIILVRDTVQDAIVSSKQLSSACTSDPDIANDILATLETQISMSSEKATFLRRIEQPNLVDYLEEAFQLSDIRSVFVKNISFAGGTKGVLFYTNPQLADWEVRSEEIMNQRRVFVHDLSERMRGQIDVYELDQEKDDLMAEVTHRLKSPMQWLMSEASTLLPRLVLEECTRSLSRVSRF